MLVGLLQLFETCGETQGTAGMKGRSLLKSRSIERFTRQVRVEIRETRRDSVYLRHNSAPARTCGDGDDPEADLSQPKKHHQEYAQQC